VFNPPAGEAAEKQLSVTSYQLSVINFQSSNASAYALTTDN